MLRCSIPSGNPDRAFLNETKIIGHCVFLDRRLQKLKQVQLESLAGDLIRRLQNLLLCDEV
jgi:hypothetical protein